MIRLFVISRQDMQCVMMQERQLHIALFSFTSNSMMTARVLKPALKVYTDFEYRRLSSLTSTYRIAKIVSDVKLIIFASCCQQANDVVFWVYCIVVIIVTATLLTQPGNDALDSF